MITQTLLIWFTAYLLGCFSTGYYWVRWQQGIDIRTVGSKTTGAFNVARVMKLPGFAITLAGDVLKGVIAMILARAFDLDTFPLMMTLIAVVLGHDFPVQLGFRGGNGLATATGALLVFDVQLGMALAVFFVVSLPVLWALKVFFKVPIQYYTPSKITVLATPVMAVVLGREGWVAIGLAVLVIIILWTIRNNMRHLAEAGKESSEGGYN